MRGVGQRASRVTFFAALTLLLSIGAAPLAAAEEARYCVTIRSDQPIDVDWISAVVAGEATIIIDEPGTCAVPVPSQGDTSGPTSHTITDLLAAVRVAPETPEGYDRDRFRHWVDADGDGCDARDEVLIEESLTAVSVGPGCRLSRGSWRSVYDGIETIDPSDFDVDHVVPLAEAWRSGAADWDDEVREAYANDLADDRVLRAVSARSNRSKSDQDPSEWLPPNSGFHCEYVSEWVVIKVRWDLATDAAERAAIEDVLDGCPNKEVVIARAPLPSPPPASEVSTVIDGPDAAEPTPVPLKKQPKPRGSCHPSYPDVCVKPPPPDLDCADIPERRFKVRGADPHRLDGDRDGIGCET